MTQPSPLLHRVALIVGGKEPPGGVEAAGSAYRSDNGQVTWLYIGDVKGVVAVNTSRTVAVVGFRRSGFEDGKHFDFGDVVVKTRALYSKASV